MFLQPKKSFIRILKRVLFKKPWIVFLVSFVIFVSFTTAVVYEQYVISQDNLAKYLPADTVLYVHFNTQKSSFANRSLTQFFSSRFDIKNFLESQTFEIFYSLWPDSNNIPKREAAYALLPYQEKFIPVLLLFVEGSPSLEQYIKIWESEGWFVHQSDDVLIVGREPFQKWRTGRGSLTKIFAAEKIPLANQFYAYADFTDYEKWPSVLVEPRIGSIIENSGYQKFKLFAVLRGDSLILTNNISILGEKSIKLEKNWLDNNEFKQSIVFKNIDLKTFFDFLDKNNKVFKNTKFDLDFYYDYFWEKYSYGLYENLIFYFDGPANILMQRKNPNSDLHDSGWGIVFDFAISSDFDLNQWEDFLKKAASYKYPHEVEKQLPDGSSYKVLAAEIHPELKFARFEFAPGMLVNSVVFKNQLWNWHYILTSDHLWVSNDRSLLTSSSLASPQQFNNFANCPELAGGYIKVNDLGGLFEEWDISSVYVSSFSSDYVVCAQ